MRLSGISYLQSMAIEPLSVIATHYWLSLSSLSEGNSGGASGTVLPICKISCTITSVFVKN